MAATPDGKGYWLVASDGGIFAFGDAASSGSMGGPPQPARSSAWRRRPTAGATGWSPPTAASSPSATPPSSGRPGDLTLDSPVVGMAVDAATGGYRLVAADGGHLLLRRAVRRLGRRPGATGPSSRSTRRRPATGSCRPTDRSTPSVAPPTSGRSRCRRWSARWSPSTRATTAGNGRDPAFIDRPIDGGGFTEPCDTAGTETASGYTEHAFNFDVATRLAALLEAGGATVVLTRSTDTGVGTVRRTSGPPSATPPGRTPRSPSTATGVRSAGRGLRRRRPRPGGERHQRQPGHRGGRPASSAPTCGTLPGRHRRAGRRTTPGSTGSTRATTSAASTSRRSRRSSSSAPTCRTRPTPP